MATPPRRVGTEQIGLYDVGRKLGKGTYATVRWARHKISKTKVAIKSINISQLDKDTQIKLEREVQIVKTIDHPHIVKCYEIINMDNMLHIVSEYCSCGELYTTVIEKGRVTEDVARKWFSETASAVSYLHSRGIVHRDLKAENILLGKNSEIKIIDFGFSTFQSGDQLLNTWCGSPPYAAPELLLGNSYDGMKADIWSMGVLLYILVAGGFPFASGSMNTLKRNVLTGNVKIPYWVSVECADFIRKMLVLNPTKRYSIQNVLQHRWMHIRDNLRKNNSAQLLDAIPSSSIEIRQQTTRLNPTIMMYMQQHGKWSEEQIVDAVVNRNFESPIFATYELLLEKAKRGSAEGLIEEHPRRGSRGSILSGKANVDEQPLTPSISAHLLAQLNLSSPDSDSDESTNSDMGDDSPISSMRQNNHYKQFGLPHGLDVIGNRFENRRHTLCASEQLLSPNMMGQFPPPNLLMNNFVLNPPLGFAPMPEGQAAEFPLSALHPALATIPIADYSKMLPVPKSERRASAGETLLPNNIDFQQHLANLSANPMSFPTVEEEGKSYLAKCGGKRNTVHCLGNQFGGGIQNPIPRYQRTPYTKAPPAERRSSWASPSLSAQQQTHLEKLFKQALQTNNDISRLHKEFKGLSHGAQSQITNEGSSLACPQISITDEYNRQHNIAPSASSFDPVSIFQKNAQEVVFGQRPATAIGFSSTSFSGMSTPEQTARSMDDRVKSIVCTLPFADVVEELKSSLNILKIPFSESHEVIHEQQVTEMRRLSLPSGVEIGVAVLPPEHKSHVEFAILNNDSPTSEILCDQLICRLRMIDPNWSSE